MSTLTSDERVMANPHIYLNYLSKDKATQFEVSRNLCLVIAGALLWDLLLSLEKDWALVKSGFRFSLIPYFLSRWAALAFTILSVVSKTRPIPHCRAFEYGIMVCWISASISSLCLFNERIRDRYRESTTVRTMFLALLLIACGISLVAPVGHGVKHISTTGYCVSTALKGFGVAAIFIRLAYGCCVFAAIWYHMVQMQGMESESPGRRESSGKRPSLRALKALLRRNQQYYLIVLVSNLVVASFIVASAPPIYQVMMTVPDIAISTSMACRVYRNLRITTNNVDTAVAGILQIAARGRNESFIAGPEYPREPEDAMLPRQRVQTKSMTSLQLYQREPRYSLIQVKPIQKSEAAKKNDDISQTEGVKTIRNAGINAA